MALHTKKLYYHRDGVTYSIDLYTDPADVGTDYIMLQDDATTVYAAVGDVTDAAASYLRIQKSDVTKAILNEFVAPFVVSVPYRPILSVGNVNISGLLTATGTVIVKGDNTYGQLDGVEAWTNVVQVLSGYCTTLGVHADGTVSTVGLDNYGQLAGARTWTDIVQVLSVSAVTYGLKSNGTVVCAGHDNFGRAAAIAGWTNIVQIAAGHNHIVGRKADGTAVAAGINTVGQCNVSGWSDLVQIAACQYRTLGVRADGTVVGVGMTDGVPGNDALSTPITWTGIAQIGCGERHTVALTTGGTVLGAGNNDYGQLAFNNTTGIALIVADTHHTAIIRASDRASFSCGTPTLPSLGVYLPA